MNYVLEEFIKELRSGNWKQCSTYEKLVDSDGNESYCFGGLAWNLMGGAWVPLDGEFTRPTTGYTAYMAWSGLTASMVENIAYHYDIPVESVSSCIGKNDRGVSFEELADILEDTYG